MMRTLLAALIICVAIIFTHPSTVAGLFAPTIGMRALVTDSTVVASGNFGAAVVGVGSHKVPVWSDGTSWFIG
jgi:hypothetical protein